MMAMLQPGVVDYDRRRSAVARLRETRVVLPTFRALADPSASDAPDPAVDPDASDPANLWRVHWFNTADRRRRAPVPLFVELPSALTGVPSPIVVLLGSPFPMIGAHKVLAAYACLVPRLVSGLFDPASDRAIWPSTGNYCRGGVAISRILGCRGVAVLPAGMSRERFDWLQRWVADPGDIIRTPGTESNVKEIYDKCAELSRESDNIILNQFAEFANYQIHYLATGRAIDAVFAQIKGGRPSSQLSLFVSATGSAGTIAAGDYLKATHGCRIAAVEAVECPTMLCNGYGKHNIQGIGDKHIPLIHNVMNMDVVAGVSDRATDALNVLFASQAGWSYLLNRRHVDPVVLDSFSKIGISGLANIVAAIKIAKRLGYGPDDVVVTVATDGASMYQSERDTYVARRYPAGVDEVNAAEIFARHIDGAADDHVLELDHASRSRIFNLGYYTWVEQQGVSVEDFERRRQPSFWRALVNSTEAWDELIDQFNAEAAVTPERQVS